MMDIMQVKASSFMLHPHSESFFLLQIVRFHTDVCLAAPLLKWVGWGHDWIEVAPPAGRRGAVRDAFTPDDAAEFPWTSALVCEQAGSENLSSDLI